MNRRTFLVRGIVATLGLTALPAVSALAKLPVTRQAEQKDTTVCEATEAEALDEILEHVQYWDEKLPGHDIKELLFQRLVRAKTGLS